MKKLPVKKILIILAVVICYLACANAVLAFYKSAVDTTLSKLDTLCREHYNVAEGVRTLYLKASNSNKAAKQSWLLYYPRPDLALKQRIDRNHQFTKITQELLTDAASIPELQNDEQFLNAANQLLKEEQDIRLTLDEYTVSSASYNGWVKHSIFTPAAWLLNYSTMDTDSYTYAPNRGSVKFASGLLSLVLIGGIIACFALFPWLTFGNWGSKGGKGDTYSPGSFGGFVNTSDSRLSPQYSIAVKHGKGASDDDSFFTGRDAPEDPRRR